jgi:hypothetical protein
MSKCSVIKNFIFQLYEGKFSNSFVMCNLLFSLWLLEILKWPVIQYISMDNFSTNHEIPIIFPVQAELLTQLHHLSSTKAWILKRRLWKFQTSRDLFLYLRIFCHFLLLFWSTVGRILNDSRHCIEVCYLRIVTVWKSE